VSADEIETMQPIIRDIGWLWKVATLEEPCQLVAMLFEELRGIGFKRLFYPH